MWLRLDVQKLDKALKQLATIEPFDALITVSYSLTKNCLFKIRTSDQI